MGTQAYWFKSGYRWRSVEVDLYDPEAEVEYGSWAYGNRTIAEAKEDFEAEGHAFAHLEKYDSRQECFVDAGSLTRHEGTNPLTGEPFLYVMRHKPVRRRA